MKLNYLLELLTTFEKEDWNDIELWSQSPIYILRKKLDITTEVSTTEHIGTNGEILMIFDFIVKNKELLNTIDIQKFSDELFNYVSQFKKTYSLESFDKRIGELSNDYIEKYIGLKLISKGSSEIRWQLQTLRFLSKNKLFYHYDLLQNKIDKKINSKENTALDLYNSYLFQKNNVGHAALKNKLNSINENFINASKTLQEFFLIEISLFSVAITNKNIIYNTTSETIDLKEKINPSVLKNNSLLKSIHSIYMVQEYIYNENIDKNVNEIEDKSSQILLDLNNINTKGLSSTIELKSCYYLLLTIAKSMIDNNYKQFSFLYFDVINSLIKKKLILQRNNINIYQLKTFIEMSIMYGKVAKANNFYQNLIKTKVLKKYTSPKKDSSNMNTFSFNQKTMVYIDSLLLFAEKKYKEAYVLLKMLKYTKQDRLDIDVDKLKLKLLFELEEVDTLSKKLNSSYKKFNDSELNLPFKQKEKMLAFIAILSSNQIIDMQFLKIAFKRKPFSGVDKKWLLEKYS